MWVEWQTNRETNLTPKQYSAWGAKHDMKENTSMRTLSLALHLCFTSFHLISKTFITWPGLYHALLAHWGRAWVWVPTRSSFMHGSWDPEVWGNQKCLDKQTCSVVRDVLFGALDNRTLCSFCSWLGSMNHEKHLKWNSTKSERNLQRLAVWQFICCSHLLTKNLEKTRQLGRVRRCRKRLARASAVNGMYMNVQRMYNCTNTFEVKVRPKLQASPVAAPGKRKSCFRFPKVFILGACVTILVRIGCGFTWRHHVQLAAKPEPCDFTLERSCFQPENRVWRTWCEGEIVRASSEGANDFHLHRMLHPGHCQSLIWQRLCLANGSELVMWEFLTPTISTKDLFFNCVWLILRSSSPSSLHGLRLWNRISSGTWCRVPSVEGPIFEDSVRLGPQLVLQRKAMGSQLMPLRPLRCWQSLRMITCGRIPSSNSTSKWRLSMSALASLSIFKSFMNNVLGSVRDPGNQTTATVRSGSLDWSGSRKAI